MQELLDLSSKAFFLFGRQDDAVDFVLAHPSISRVHAVAQYRNDGALLLLDMKSAQGTFVNRKRLEEGIYERLYVGDVIKFGASTRHYIVNGPDEHTLAEYDSENLRAYRQRLAEQNQNAARLKAQDDMSWGMGVGEVMGTGDGNDDEDDDLPTYLKNDPSYNRKKSNVRETEFGSSEKEKALFVKIRAKELKIDQLEGENRKIHLNGERGGTGLTSGQSAAMGRNDQVIAKLENEVAELLKMHRERNSGKTGSGTAATAPDDEDFLDETCTSADASTNWRMKKRQQQPANHQQKQTEVWTYEGLLSARAANQSKLAVLASLKTTLEAGHVAVVDEEEDDDESSRVLAAEIRKDVQAQLTKIATEKQVLEINDARFAALLEIAAPAIHTQTAPREEVKKSNPLPPAPAGAQQGGPTMAKRSLQGGVSECLKMMSSEASSGLKRKSADAEKDEHVHGDGTKAKKAATYDELDAWLPPPAATSGDRSLKDKLGY